MCPIYLVEQSIDLSSVSSTSFHNIIAKQSNNILSSVSSTSFHIANQGNYTLSCSISSTTSHIIAKSSSPNPSTVSTYTLPTDVNKRSFSSVTLGIILTPILVSVMVIITITLVVGLFVCAKVRKNGKSEVSVVHNDAYGIGLQDMAIHTYDYPTMGHLNVESFDIKANEAYATNIKTRGNEAYATNIKTRGNEAYATNIEMMGNEAYATNIVTQPNVV